MKNKQEYKQQNERYWAEMRRQEGVKELGGGVLYRVIDAGPEEGPMKTTTFSVVTCRYRGKTIDGRVFDDTFGQPFPEAFRVNELIPGFQQALLNMREGDHWEVVVPAAMGYGSRGTDGIKGYSTLIFEIEVLSIY